jgi:enoyl-CoA hydratase
VPYSFIRYDLLDDGAIARVTLNRPDKRNAQNRGLLVELDDALMQAEADDDVRVVVLAGAGRDFSAGHDLGSAEHRAERDPGPQQHPAYQNRGGRRSGADRRYHQEWHYYLQATRRWRDLRKIMIAQVQGNVISAGLMLMWACDLVVAADSAAFADLVGVRLGMAGVEYFAHPWEFGPRKAKELLLTGSSLTAADAERIGMVNKVVAEAELDAATLALARQVASLPTATSLFIKDSVNQAVDAMGFGIALDAAFSLHQLNHAYWAELSGGRTHVGTAEYGLSAWRPGTNAGSPDRIGAATVKGTRETTDSAGSPELD